MKITMIVMLMLVGFSFGGVPLFGFLYGSKKWGKLRRSPRFCTAFLCGLAAVESLAVFLFAKPLMSVFIQDASIIRDGVLMMRWQISSMIFTAVVLLYTCVPGKRQSRPIAGHVAQPSGSAVPGRVPNRDSCCGVQRLPGRAAPCRRFERDIGAGVVQNHLSTAGRTKVRMSLFKFEQ